MLPSVSTHDSRRATQVTLKAVVLLASVAVSSSSISFVFSDRGLPSCRTPAPASPTARGHHAARGENARLRAEIESVKKSTYAVERIAREDLGMSKRARVVYMLPKK